MKFDTYLPTGRLRPYIRSLVVSENDSGSEYTVLPSGGLVTGFQYKGRLSLLHNTHEARLAPAGITGIADRYKRFRNSAGIGTVLVYFTETGFAHFASLPAHALFNQSLSLDEVFDKSSVAQVEEQLSLGITDAQRIRAVEQFWVGHLRDLPTDKPIDEAVRLICQSQGALSIKALSETLCLSQSPFEKRFRQRVGTTPKKFASIVRFNAVLNHLSRSHSLTEIGYTYGFFDQAHFIKDFKQFSGQTPEQFRRLL
jgi:AraC-like DNA-binding protein